MSSNVSIVVVTGANSGVGYQAVKHLYTSTKSYKIYLGARSVERAQAAIESIKVETGYTGSNQIVPLILDINSDESIAEATKVLQAEGRIDVLINNAGVLLEAFKDRTGSQRQLFLDTFNTNVFGTHELTLNLAPLLLKSTDPRIIFVSSDVGSNVLAHLPASEFPPNGDQPAGWENKDFKNAWPAYRASKAALNILSVDWKRWLKEDGVKIWTINPGFVATNLGVGQPDILKSLGAVEPAISGEFLRDIVEGKRDEDAGKYIDVKGVLPY